jgi:hypothetical protein
MALVDPIRKPSYVVEDGSPTNRVNIEEVTVRKQPLSYHVTPDENTGSVAYAMNAIRIMSKPLRERTILVEIH